MTYTEQERRSAAAWKRTTSTLPADAGRPAGYVGKDARPGSTPYDFCLPPEHAALSLLPEVRETALRLFVDLGIPWHAGVDGGPSNHLLSSQVQCVNALGQMVADPDRLRRCFADVLGTEEVLQIEPGRFLTFEYIGPGDVFNEVPDGERVRGARCTSIDAAFLHRTTDGVTELVLLEWKYTESYRPRRSDSAKNAVRRQRYGSFLCDPSGPVRDDVLPFDDLLDEPFYQLVRQQLLAHSLERTATQGAQRVRVVHVSPVGNTAYQQSLQPAHRRLGEDVSTVWAQLLRRPDRFVALDSAHFLDEKVTSREYVLRYSPEVIRDMGSLLRLTGTQDVSYLENHLYAAYEFDGEVALDGEGVTLTLGSENLSLSYPFTLGFLVESLGDLEAEVVASDADVGVREVLDPA